MAASGAAGQPDAATEGPDSGSRDGSKGEQVAGGAAARFRGGARPGLLAPALQRQQALAGRHALVSAAMGLPVRRGVHGTGCRCVQGAVARRQRRRAPLWRLWREMAHTQLQGESTSEQLQQHCISALELLAIMHGLRAFLAQPPEGAARRCRLMVAPPDGVVRQPGGSQRHQPRLLQPRYARNPEAPMQRWRRTWTAFGRHARAPWRGRRGERRPLPPARGAPQGARSASKEASSPFLAPTTAAATACTTRRTTRTAWTGVERGRPLNKA